MMLKVPDKTNNNNDSWYSRCYRHTQCLQYCTGFLHFYFKLRKKQKIKKTQQNQNNQRNKQTKKKNTKRVIQIEKNIKVKI